MNKKMGLIYVFITTVFFSSMEVAVKLSKGAFNPIQLNFIRFFIAGLILTPIAVHKIKSANYILKKTDYLMFFIFGFLNVVLSMNLYISSVSYIPAYTAAIVYSSNTFFSIMFASFILKEKINKLTAFSLFLAFLGIVYIINPFNFEGNIIGFILCLTAGMIFAFYAVLGKSFSRKTQLGSIVNTSFGFLFGVLQLLILIVLSHIPAISNLFIHIGLENFSMIPIFKGINSQNILILIFICLGVTGTGFACYFLAMDNLPVALVSLVFFTKPVLAPIIAYIVLGEVVSKHNLIGLCLIVLASCILFYSNTKKK